MRKNISTGRKFRIVIFSFLLSSIAISMQAQHIQFSLWTDPMIAWWSTDTRETINEGVRPGFTFGIAFDRYFSDNYAFSTGIFLMNTGGKLSYSDTTLLRFKNSETRLPAGEILTYRVQYLTIPVGLKFNTNQIGYITFFTNVGLDPRVMISGKGDISSQDIKNENITEELKLINLGYHINAGIEYSLGGSTAIAVGLGYENNFLDATYDFSDQPVDQVKNHIIRFKIGIIF